MGGLPVDTTLAGQERAAPGTAVRGLSGGLPGAQPPAPPIARVGLPSTWQRPAGATLSRQAIVDMFTRPAMLIDGRLFVQVANRAAERQLLEGRWVAGRQGQLQCADADSAARLCARVHDMVLAAQLHEPVSSRWVRLDDAARTAVLPATLTLLSADARRPVDAQVLLTLHDPGYGGHVDPLMLESLFGMTPAEARVACALVRGLSPQEAADACGVALGTVRTQLKAVFAKTRTRRQAELVRLLIGLSPA